jgi:hypothetical protein
MVVGGGAKCFACLFPTVVKPHSQSLLSSYGQIELVFDRDRERETTTLLLCLATNHIYRVNCRPKNLKKEKEKTTSSR